MDELYEEIPADLACSVPEKTDVELVRIDCEVDELWSFVGWKANKHWLWLALDRASRQVVALFMSDRTGPPVRCGWGIRSMASFAGAIPPTSHLL